MTISLQTHTKTPSKLNFDDQKFPLWTFHEVWAVWKMQYTKNGLKQALKNNCACLMHDKTDSTVPIKHPTSWKNL
jgi:hypothetical protein